MALRTNHYDVAFEAYIRHRKTPYVAVDEQRRALLEQASLKSMDFIVYSAQRLNLLVDVKGRQFPSGHSEHGHKWENWATADDIPSLLQWQTVFGEGFRAVLVFAYHVLRAEYFREFEELFEYRERYYAFYGVWVDDYHREMKTRSESWQTVSLPSQTFRELRRPIAEFF